MCIKLWIGFFVLDSQRSSCQRYTGRHCLPLNTHAGTRAHAGSLARTLVRWHTHTCTYTVYTLSLSLTVTHTHSLSLSLSHARASAHTHTDTHTHTETHTHTCTHTHTQSCTYPSWIAPYPGVTMAASSCPMARCASSTMLCKSGPCCQKKKKGKKEREREISSHCTASSKG